MAAKKFTMNSLQKAINSNIIERERLSFAGKGLDQKHDRIWTELGYKHKICAPDYRFAYERHPAANAAVHRVLDKCWEKFPEIIQDDQDKEVETPWEKETNKLMKHAYAFLRDADRRNLVNRYSCLLIQFADGKQWREPVNNLGSLKDKAIVKYIPTWEEDMTVTEWHQDVQDPKYGEPKMWAYNPQRTLDENTDGEPMDTIDIHPDRVLVLAEGAMDGSIYSGI